MLIPGYTCGNRVVISQPRLILSSSALWGAEHPVNASGCCATRRWELRHPLPIRQKTDLPVGLTDGQAGSIMWAIAFILFALWALGMLTAHTLGGLLHLFLILAVIVVIVKLFRGRSRA